MISASFSHAAANDNENVQDWFSRVPDRWGQVHDLKRFLHAYRMNGRWCATLWGIDVMLETSVDTMKINIYDPRGDTRFDAVRRLKNFLHQHAPQSHFLHKPVLYAPQQSGMNAI